MKFDSMLDATPGGVIASAERALAGGRDGGWVIDTAHDPFIVLAVAAASRTPLSLGTAVAVGFARTPMLLALVGNDLQIATGGRFILGLGSQVRPHIERRFSMPWGKPLARMREMVAAIHAIWDAWETDVALDFRGEYYTHTLMTAAFNPGPNGHGRPPIYLGALGPGMSELAGELADGIIIHRLMSQRYLHEVTLPAIARGLAKRERPLASPFEIVYPPFVASAGSEAELSVQIADIRSSIAFYGSTPGYRGVLELHGWEAIGDELNAMSREGRWDAMPALVTEDMVQTLALISAPGEVETDLEKRFGEVVDRAILYPPF